MSTNNDTGSDIPDELAVLDANELKQRTRLKNILDHQQKVQIKEDEAYEFYANGGTKDAKNILLLRALKQYIREAYNLLVDYHEDLEDDQVNYLTGVNLGEIQFTGTENKEFWGLQDILDADNFYRETWQTTVHSRHGQDVTRVHEKEHTVPEEVIDNGFLLLRRFLGQEMDMDLTLEELEDADDAELKYADLLPDTNQEATADD